VNFKTKALEIMKESRLYSTDNIKGKKERRIFLLSFHKNCPAYNKLGV
jgi:hypothetical protein